MASRVLEGGAPPGTFLTLELGRFSAWPKGCWVGFFSGFARSGLYNVCRSCSPGKRQENQFLQPRGKPRISVNLSSLAVELTVIMSVNALFSKNGDEMWQHWLGTEASGCGLTEPAGPARPRPPAPSGQPGAELCPSLSRGSKISLPHIDASVGKREGDRGRGPGCPGAARGAGTHSPGPSGPVRAAGRPHSPWPARPSTGSPCGKGVSSLR